MQSDLQIRIEENEAIIETNDLPKIECDATQMRQLIQNLVSNALKFRKADQIPVIKILGELQDATDSSKTKNLMITISDNGIGFDNSFKEQIFTIFQRLHSRNEYEGTGIGLATCRKIVERHGGTIEASGVQGEGSTFKFIIPQTQSTKEISA